MKLNINKKINKEICHYADSQKIILSKFNKIYIKQNSKENIIQLPGDGWKSLFAMSRLARRALRLDKCNVLPVGDDLIVIRQGKVYHYCHKSHQLTKTLQLKNCRNVLHQSIAIAGGDESGVKEVFFGEYGHNPERGEVPLYKSSDGGKSWQVIFTFAKAKIKHIHGCYWDAYEEKIWVFTGDFAGECHILCADKNFEQVEWIGNGQQAYRACNAFFEKDKIHWIMDSPLQDSYHIVLDRVTRTIEKKQLFPGPVWYIKKLSDGIYLAATAQEIGPGVKDKYAHLMVSRNLESWESLYQFQHDGLPKRYFKFGVIGFADGEQSSNGFYLFCEAIKGFDGEVAHCSIS